MSNLTPAVAADIVRDFFPVKSIMKWFQSNFLINLLFQVIFDRDAWQKCFFSWIQFHSYSLGEEFAFFLWNHFYIFNIWHWNHEKRNSRVMYNVEFPINLFSKMRQINVSYYLDYSITSFTKYFSSFNLISRKKCMLLKCNQWPKPHAMF